MREQKKQNLTDPNVRKRFVTYKEAAFIMAYLLYQWVYAEETKKVPGYSKRPVFQYIT